MNCSLSWCQYLIAISIVLACMAEARAITCAQARSTVEHAVCSDPGLRVADDKLSDTYRQIREQTGGPVRQAFTAQQRAWIADRDRLCASGAVSCLRESYAERQAQLDALAARSVNLGPAELTDLTPLSLSGSWTADVLTQLGGEARRPDAGLHLAAASAHLPKPGQVVTGQPGRICYDQRCGSAGLEGTTVSQVMQDLPAVAGLGLPPSAPAYVVYLTKWTSFDLLAGADGRLLAVARACAPQSVSGCATIVQVWAPQEADARVVNLLSVRTSDAAAH